MRGCPYHPHMETTGSQLSVPKVLYIFENFPKVGNLMYLAPKYM